MNALATQLKPAGSTVDQARQHMTAAKALGRDISFGFSADLAGIAASAKSIEALSGIVRDGVREEARKLAAFIEGAQARIERLLVLEP